MTPSQITRIVSIVMLSIAVSACGTTSPSRFYTLNSTASIESQPDVNTSVAVGPVSIPDAVNRPQFVVTVGPNRVEIDEYERWAAPLDDSISRVVAGNLSVLLGKSQIIRAPMTNFDPAFRVTIDIQRFESVAGESVTDDAVWIVRRSKDGITRSGRTVARETVQSKDYEELAAAHSRALQQVSRDIAAAIRESAEKP
jgi:uncharacterized lipoprotein YmbA